MSEMNDSGESQYVGINSFKTCKKAVGGKIGGTILKKK